MVQDRTFEPVQTKIELGTKAMIDELRQLMRQPEDAPSVPAYWALHVAVKEKLERERIKHGKD